MFALVAAVAAVHADNLTAFIDPRGSNNVLRDALVSRGVRIVDNVDNSLNLLWLSSDGPWKGGIGRAALNRIPGMDLLTSKPSLTAAARAFSWSFVPFTPASAEEATALPGSGMPFSWIFKAATHRGVRVLPALPGDRVSIERMLSDGVLQRRLVDPVLAGDRAFDVGVYVLVTRSVAGRLSYWMYQDVLLRFCELPLVHVAEAERALANASTTLHELQRGWVVDEKYIQAWEVPSLRQVLSCSSARSRDALSHIMGQWRHPLLAADVWRQFDEAVATTLGAVQGVEDVVALRNAGGGSFELVRCRTRKLVERCPTRRTEADSKAHVAGPVRLYRRGRADLADRNKLGP